MIIVDTNVLIDIERGKKSVKELFEKFQDEHFCISAVSILELYVGLGYSKSKKGENFYQKQKKKVDSICNDFEIIPLSLQIIKEAGLKKGNLMVSGIIVDFEDILIGVTGEILEVNHLFTRNKKHFENFSLSIQEY
ncbi:MAG: type II toxin-antitoxin system VapC family toxin [Promethearchaeota archaeon]